MNFFDHKDLGNHLLQLCPKVVKHPVYRQSLHVSGVSRHIIRRYNRMYTTIGTYYPLQMTVCFPIQPGQQTVV